MVLCQNCGRERSPACRPGLCQSCRTESTRAKYEKKYQEKLVLLGYEFISNEPGSFIDVGNKRFVKVRNRECNHEFVSQLDNILNGRSKCGVCGPKKRWSGALKKYVEKHGRDYDLKVWNDYLWKVRRLSEKTYDEHIDIINPLRLNRTRHDKDENCFHLDHVVPIIVGFKRQIDPELMASVENLRMEDGSENISRNKKLTPEAERLLETWLINT